MNNIHLNRGIIYLMLVHWSGLGEEYTFEPRDHILNVSTLELK